MQTSENPTPTFTHSPVLCGASDFKGPFAQNYYGWTFSFSSSTKEFAG